MDLDQVVLDLNKMGVSFQEVSADADKFATTLKQVDDVRLQQTADGLDNVRTKMDTMRSSSDQSRSVLANLSGNAAQDLGELGGVVGSLGVGIGQLAEYAVDGNIKLNQLASVAGPMAGLSAALLLIQHVMGGIAKAKAFKADEVEAYAEAIEDVGAGSAAVLDHLQEVGKFQFAADSGLLGFGTTIKDVTGLLDQYGVTASELSRVIAGTDAEQAAWFESLRNSGIEANDLAKIMVAVNQAITGYDKGLKRAETTQAVFASSAADVAQAMGDMSDEAEQVDALWRVVLEGLRDGSADLHGTATVTDQTTAAWNRLREILGLTEEEMAAIVDQKLDEQLLADAEAAQELTDAIGAAVDHLAEMNEGLELAAAEFDPAAARASAFAAALDEINRVIPGLAQVAEAQVMSDFAGGIDDVVTALKDLPGPISDLPDQLVPDDWASALDISEEEQALLDSLSGMAGQIQTEMAKAFEGGGAAGVTQWATDTARAITDQLIGAGVTSQEEINKILGYLGLLPEQVDMAIRISGEQQARDAVNLILGAVGDVPPEVVVSVAAKMADDPVAALRELVSYLEGQGVEVPANLVPDVSAVPAAVEAIPEQTLPITAYANLDDAGIDLDAFTGEKRTASINGQAETKRAKDDLDETAEDRTAKFNLSILQLLVTNLLLDAVAEDRTAKFIAKADNAGQVDGILDGVAADRDADIWVDLPNYVDADRRLEQLARTRHSNIIVHTVSAGGGRGSSGGGGLSAGGNMAAPLAAAPMAMATAGVAPLAAPAVAPMSISPLTMTAPTPVVNNFSVAVSAAVVGNRHETERVIAKALRNYTRLNGSRNN